MKHRTMFCLVVLMGAISIPVTGRAQHAEFYVLDGFGGVHAGGGAPAITPLTPYFGFDIAKDIAYVPGETGDGYLVVDGFGGVHAGGSAGASGLDTPYFGFDVARAIAYRSIPSRANGNFNDDAVPVTSTSFTSVASTTISAPDDGFVLLISNANMFCSAAATGGARTDVSVSIDSATVPLAGFEYVLTIPDCTLVTAAAWERRTVSVSNLFSVSAGTHTVHLLAKDGSGPLHGVLLDPTIAAIYIDQGFDGETAPLSR